MHIKDEIKDNPSFYYLSGKICLEFKDTLIELDCDLNTAEKLVTDLLINIRYFKRENEDKE